MAENTAPEALVEFIAKGIVENPDDIHVSVKDGTLIELETNPDDRGRVIGRQGRIAKAMRALLAASRTGGNHRLDIVD